MKPSSFIQRLTRKNSNGSVERAKPRSLRVESLESRELLSVSTAELSVVDANNDRLGLPLDVCEAPSFHESTPALVESSANSERPTCLENTEAELIIADLRAFDATVDELLTTAGQNINNLSEEFIFSLNSRPGSDYTIYLDFNGNEYKGSEWNGGQKVTTPPYDSQHYPYDGDAVVPYDNYKDDPAFSEFTNSELRDIYEIWYRVSEDFSPFDVNVTTQEPANDQFADNTRAIRVAIGGTCYDWYKTSGQTAAGGVANTRFSDNTSAPCYVFPWQLYAIDDSNNDQKYIFPKFVADTVSHEIGHTLGLNHDGTCAHDGIAAETYYEGADNWAPLMGNAWYQDLTQWSKSEYQYANNNQDELDIITTSNGFGYRDDDHGDTIATATPLSFDNSGALVYNAPGELVSGIIERNTDVDFFSFNLNGEKTVIKIGGVRSATNLDVLVNLYKANGELVEPVKTYDPLDTFYVAIDTKDLPSGKYYLGVSGTGRTVDGVVHYTDYGSLGAYTITTDNFFDAYEPNEPSNLAYDLGLVSGAQTFENAYVGGADSFDYYLFTIGSSATSANYVKVDYTYVPNKRWAHLRVQKFDGDQNKWILVSDSHVDHGDEETVAFEIVSLENLPAGQYRIRVANYGDGQALSNDEHFPYSLTISAPSVPLLDSIVLLESDSINAGTITTAKKTLMTAVSPANANVVYQWYRGTRSDFVTTPIIGATGSSYTTTAADVGCYLTVKAFGVDGYEGTVDASTTQTFGTIEPSIISSVVVTSGNDEKHDDNFVVGTSFTTDDFPSDETSYCLSLREAYDYVNWYFVGAASDNLNDLSNWRQVENENSLFRNDATGEYYYVDAEKNKKYVVVKTIEFDDGISSVALASELETNKTFTINGGNVSVSISPAQGVESRIFKVTSGVITADNITLKNGSATDGGAIYIGANGAYVANGGKFTTNAATNGGAVYVDSNETSSGTFTAYDVNFEQNVALRRGGAILNKGTVYVVDGGTGASKFDQNKAETRNNAGGSFGGAIYNVGTVAINATDATKPVVFSNNKATGTGTLAAPGGVLNGYSGGAIYNSKGTITITNAKFTDNFAGKYGGAISNFATLNVANSSFYSNVASAGGAVQTSGDATFTNATFGGVDENNSSLGNTALKSKSLLVADSADYGGNGGAIFASGVGKSVTFKGATTFDGNRAANAGGAIDYVSGSLTFNRNGFTAPELKCLTITNNKARTIGGAAVFAGAVVFVDYDVNVDNEKTDVTINDNSVGALTATNVDQAFHRSPEALNKDSNNNVVDALYAPNVAVTCDTGDQEIQNLGKVFFNAVDPARNLLDVFTRYTTSTNYKVSFADLASSFTVFTTDPPTIHVSVNGGTYATYYEGDVVSLPTTQTTHTVRYYEGDNENVFYTMRVMVDSSMSVSVTASKFDLGGRDYISSAPLAVGVTIRTNSGLPIKEWTLNWGDGTTVTINNYGYTCNAYHIYAPAQQDVTRKLSITAKNDNNQTITFENAVSFDVPGTGAGSGAVLDAESDFFAELDLVDELFED